jgi:tRNA(Ile)-lysidine synthetase-like protein
VETLAPIQPGTYIIAVSGGVDSVSLLDILAKQQATLIVAHFDHGMRPDSRADEQFVAGLAKQYKLGYVTERKELGATSSEAAARRARYDFLFRARQKFNASKIITAHHSDDIIETMMINIIRGTGWRGLCSLKNTADIYRPFLKVSKADIMRYANTHNLKWKEDSTNQNQGYLRNAIRHQLLPLADSRAWLDLYEKQVGIAERIDEELYELSSPRRYDYIMWPPSVALEVIRRKINLTRIQAEYALAMIKTALPGATVMVGDKKKLEFTRDSFVVTEIET